MSMKMMTAFWNMASCNLQEVYGRFSCAYRLHRPDDGDIKYLWNVGILLRDYTAQ
jgi:hypothetical protein